MPENEVCKGCRWNKYPECLGTIGPNGNYIRIDNLRPVFRCGQKDIETVSDLSIKPKTKDQEKIEELEARIEALENAKASPIN